MQCLRLDREHGETKTSQCPRERELKDQWLSCRPRSLLSQGSIGWLPTSQMSHITNCRSQLAVNVAGDGVQDTVSLNGIFLFFVIAFGTHFKHGSPVIIMYWQLKITRGIHLKKGGGGQIVTLVTVAMPTSFHQIREGAYSGRCQVTAANTLSIAKLRTSNFVSGK